MVMIAQLQKYIKNHMAIFEDVEKKEPSCPVGGMQTGAATVEVPQKVKIKLPYNPAIALMGIYPKETKTLIQRHTCTPVYSSIIYNSQDMEATQVSHQFMKR